MTLSLGFLFVPNGDKTHLLRPYRVLSELQVPGTNEGLKKGKAFLLSPCTPTLSRLTSTAKIRNTEPRTPQNSVQVLALLTLCVTVIITLC